MTGTTMPQRVLLERIKAHAEASPEVIGLLLFGSFATGNEDEQSDLDIGLYIDGDAFEGFDLRRWLEPIADVGAIYVDEYCSTVIFGDLTRAEVHLGPASAAEAWPRLAGVIAFPSLERMVLLDRTGTFADTVGPLIGSLPDRGPADAAHEFLGLANGLLVADGCRRRGDLARALAHLTAAQKHLLRLARVVDGATNEWIAPERGLAADLTAAAFERYAEATAWLDAQSIALGIERSWRWGRELAEDIGVHPIPAAAIRAMDARFAGPGGGSCRARIR
ncbi:MAG: nucleotidyltransferase domain-containing protein [Chloroflexota bacterium]